MFRLLEHDGQSTRSLGARIANALTEGTVALILDLAESHIDGPLLHLLVVTDKAVAARSGCLIVLCGEEPARLLHVSGIDAHLSLAQSLHEALDRVAAYG